MITDRQNRFYWSLWGKARKELMRGRETFTGAEENNRRHELHVRALGYDKSHVDLSNREFDKVIAELRAIIDPSDLEGQLSQINQPARRLFYGLYALMRELHVDLAYVSGIVKRMNENGELGSRYLGQLDVDGLRKVMVALREHQRRAVAASLCEAPAKPRIYKLRPVA